MKDWDRPDIAGIRWNRAKKNTECTNNADIWVGVSIIGAAVLMIVLAVLGK